MFALVVHFDLGTIGATIGAIVVIGVSMSVCIAQLRGER